MTKKTHTHTSSNPPHPPTSYRKERERGKKKQKKSHTHAVQQQQSVAIPPAHIHHLTTTSFITLIAASFLFLLHLTTTTTTATSSSSSIIRLHRPLFLLQRASSCSSLSFSSSTHLHFPPTTTSRRLASRRTFFQMSTDLPPSSSSSTTSTHSQLLPFKSDHYQGVIIDTETLPTNPTLFATQLDASLAYWKQEQKRGIWLKLPLALSSLVPIAAARGFIYHHAEPTYLMMTHWLDTTHSSTLPPGPTHQVGVGALVLDESGTRILAVQEKSGPLKGSGVWKMPTGLLDAGEDIGVGAEREVKEETGVVARFESVVAFRHAHDFATFGQTSDLFFVVRLKCLDAATLCPCPREIERAEFIPLQEFLGQPRFQASPLYACVYDLCRDVCTNGGKEEEEGVVVVLASPPPAIVGTRLEMGFRPGTALLYHTSRYHHEKHTNGGKGNGGGGEG